MSSGLAFAAASAVRFVRSEWGSAGRWRTKVRRANAIPSRHDHALMGETAMADAGRGTLNGHAARQMNASRAGARASSRKPVPSSREERCGASAK